MQRIGVIDIGTNTILCLLAEERTDGRIVSLKQGTETVRLGRGLDSDGLIRDEALDRAVGVLNSYKDIVTQHGIDDVRLVGTHVLRSAFNREAVADQILSRTGLKVEILSTAEEAEWSFRGAVYDRTMKFPVCVADIGGGSTEITLGRKSYIDLFDSAPFGSVSMTERILIHDPPTQLEFESLQGLVFSALTKKMTRSLQQAETLIAVGGSVTSLAAMTQGLKRYDPDLVDGFSLKQKEILRWIDIFRQENRVGRERRMPFDPERADIIPAGAIILNLIMETGAFKTVTVSDRGLRFGIVLRALQKISTPDPEMLFNDRST